MARDYICSVEGCNRWGHARGWCEMHYRRFMRTGHAVRPPRTIDWFSSRVRVDENGCWIWLLRIDRNGYTRVQFEGHSWSGHRLAWTLANGPIPADMTIDHLCFVKRCVNPEHLRLLTQVENARRQRKSRAVQAAEGLVA